jgi:glutamate decarboxylase
MPEHAEDVALLRIVVREGFSSDMASMLLADIRKAVEHFEGLTGHTPKPAAPQFAH